MPAVLDRDAQVAVPVVPDLPPQQIQRLHDLGEATRLFLVLELGLKLIQPLRRLLVQQRVQIERIDRPITGKQVGQVRVRPTLVPNGRAEVVLVVRHEREHVPTAAFVLGQRSGVQLDQDRVAHAVLRLVERSPLIDRPLRSRQHGRVVRLYDLSSSEQRLDPADGVVHGLSEDGDAVIDVAELLQDLVPAVIAPELL
ncbi:hypothetical protein SPH9361_04041 [Sphingobium sp. CECT 9361]|nr:hypothetical protein SPH9361_04041 [Sphingobium sp. CECT 9361]